MTNSKRFVLSIGIGCFILALVIAIMSGLFMDGVVFDSRGKRAQVASRLRDLASKVRNDNTDAVSFNGIISAAESAYRFERCYALGALGGLGEAAVPAIPTIVKGLKSDDRFVRHAAAEALYNIGKSAVSAKDDLVRLIRDHVSEGASEYAIMALGRIGDGSPEVLDVLIYAIRHPNGAGKEEARRIYEQLTGAMPPG